MGNGKGEYKERGCGAEREGILRMRKKRCKTGLVSTCSMVASWMNELHKDIAKSTACSTFLFVKSYQGVTT
jgi:hypothetical protein